MQLEERGYTELQAVCLWPLQEKREKKYLTDKMEYSIPKPTL